MEKKNMIIIGVIVVIIAIVCVIFATGVLNNNEKTSFETDFMSGAFAGNVSKSDTNESFLASYVDNENKITYNLSTMDNSSALMEIYKFHGIIGPEERSFNGNKWNIYFGEAIPVVNNSSNQSSNESMGIVICESQQEKQGYVIYAIFSDLSKVNFTLNTYGDSYTKYIEPLLNSIHLKESNNVLSINEEFGLSKDEFNQQLELIHQINAGNYSVVEG